MCPKRFFKMLADCKYRIQGTPRILEHEPDPAAAQISPGALGRAE
jgi:hypothetical protein